jgi:hypothetical protein
MDGGDVMRAGFASYFDLGNSYGVTDRVFKEDRISPPANISMVGISNPLGCGVTLDLVDENPAVIEAWRREADAQLNRPELEPGWQPGWPDLPRQRFDAQVREVINGHPISCLVTLYALGIGYLRFEITETMDPRLVDGVLTCFEYAAYRPVVASAILSTAQTHLNRCLKDRNTAHLNRFLKDRNKEFPDLTARPVAARQSDTDGYEEIAIFPAFTHIVRCMDEDSADQIQQLRTLLLPATGFADIEFEYHGTLTYTWAACLVSPRSAPQEPIAEEMARIEECFRIAHASVGICEAFLRMFEDEIAKQVESLIVGPHAGRDSEALNKLRALALAVVSLTNLGRVTQTDEDRKYFEAFTASAQLEYTQQRLTNSVEVLYSVQDAEAQHDQIRRESLLNGVVVLLASLTLVSVSVDAYNFLSAQDDPLIEEQLRRAQLLLEFGGVLTMLVIIFLWWVIRRPRKRR